METSQEERDAVRHYLGGDARWQEEPPAHVHETAIGALNDADRLARLEDGIRALADQLDAEPPDNTLIHDDVGTVADVAKRLRALLGEE